MSSLCRAVVVLIACWALSACRRASSAEQAPLAVQSAPPVIPGNMIGPPPGPNPPVQTVINPYADDMNALREGRRLFIYYNCYGCHGGRAGGGMGPSLRDYEWLYGNSAGAIYNSIAEGRRHGMPAWGLKIPSEQIWKLVAYISSLNTDAEVDKPPKNPSYPYPPSAGAPERAATIGKQ